MAMEKYNIFFDSPVGLLSGTLDLCQTECGLTGHITMMGRGTNITDGHIMDDKRDFYGTVWLREEEVPFHAQGVLEDGMLELDMNIGAQLFPLTGFPISE